jgi:hypothetical protein
MTEIKRMDIKEFREFGFLQEVNRLFFHPLGLALEVIIDEETGEVELGGVWDYREDPEGNAFGEGTMDPEKTKRVEELRQSKIKARVEKFGWELQPVEGE